jgi:hypothetical protein
MSDEHQPYCPLYIKAWSILSIVMAACLFLGFVLCNHLLHAGDVVWSIIRWIFSPII